MLRRLAELGWLPDVDVISTVSGGSILVGAFAVLRWEAFLQAGGDAEAFESIIAAPFLERVQTHNFLIRWLQTSWRWPFRKFASKTFTRSQAAAELFDEIFFEGRDCSALPESPISSHFERDESCNQRRRGGLPTRVWEDSRIGHAKWGSNPLSLSICVGASAAFPPVFPPVRIERNEYTFTEPIYGESALPVYPLIPLTDGGVYDNSGP